MDPLPAQHPASPFIIERRNFSLGPDQITCNSKVLISPSYSASTLSFCLSSFPMPSPASSDHHPSSTYWIPSPHAPRTSPCPPQALNKHCSANEESRRCYILASTFIMKQSALLKIQTARPTPLSNCSDGRTGEPLQCC